MLGFRCYENNTSDKDSADFLELHSFFAVDKYPSKTAVIYDDGENFPVTQTYKEINSAANRIKSFFEISGQPRRFVGVACPQNSIFPAVLLGIMKAKCGFYNISRSQILEDVKFAQTTISMKHLLIEDSIYQLTVSKLKSVLKEEIASYEFVEGNKIVILRIFILVDSILNNAQKENSSLEYPYAIRTSGTTGSKKMVLVPNSCIVPNIIYFINSVWKTTSNDVVFGASPVTFDPSICELFTAFGSGAAILYVPQSVKLVGDLLAKILRKHRVTILQITPSLFRRIEKNLISEGFFDHGESSLEVLSFGGEKCLEKGELRKIIDAKMFERLRRRGLQNLYGITEVSCWASVECIDLNSESEITIGHPILNTLIHLGEDGSISIGSKTRVCKILDSNGDQLPHSFQNDDSYFYDTGDIGVIKEESTGIIYVARKDRVVKRNGYKTSLIEIENSAMATNLLRTASCVFYNDKIYLVVKLIATNHTGLTAQRINDEFIPKLSLDIPPQIYPDVIIPVEDIPVNQNGKIDMDRIISIAEYQRYKNTTVKNGPSHVHFKFQKDLFFQALQNIWMMCTNQVARRSPNNVQKNEQLLLSKRFIEAGGDSLSAVRFIEEIFTYLNLFGSDTHAKYEKEVLRRLILEDFDKVFDFLCDIAEKNPVDVSVTAVTTLPILENECHNLEPHNDNNCTNTSQENCLKSIRRASCQENPLTTNYLRKRKQSKKDNVRVCIKSPPEITFSCSYDLRMCVDSSAAVISGLNSVNGAVVVIGSHSGYALGIALCKPIANHNHLPEADRFPIQWETHLGGRIEATATVHPNNLSVYFGTHNNRLYSLNVLTGHINWRFECSHSVRAAPVVASQGNTLIFVDENALYSLNSFNGELLWRHENVRHMSTCNPEINETFVFLTTVTNKIEAIDLKLGSKKWTQKGSSSDMRTAYCTAPILVKCTNAQQLLLVGTRNGRVEALNPKNGNIIWTCEELKVDSFSPNTVPFDPIKHICCDNPDCDDSFTIFLNHVGKGVVIFSETGAVLRSFDLNLNLSSPPCIVCTHKTTNSLEPSTNTSTIEERTVKRTSSSNSKYYMIFYAEGVLTFVDISDPYFRFDLKTDFDSEATNFSKPIAYNNYVLVGGRDNKLHVFELASLTA